MYQKMIHMGNIQNFRDVLCNILHKKKYMHKNKENVAYAVLIEINNPLLVYRMWYTKKHHR